MSRNIFSKNKQFSSKTKCHPSDLAIIHRSDGKNKVFLFLPITLYSDFFFIYHIPSLILFSLLNGIHSKEWGNFLLPSPQILIFSFPSLWLVESSLPCYFLTHWGGSDDYSTILISCSKRKRNLFIWCQRNAWF